MFMFKPMKYRTKLSFVFGAVGVISSIGGMGVLYYETKPFIFEDEQIKAVSVAATTAALIDGNLFHQIQTAADINTPAFQQIKQELRKARDANRRTNVYINFLYTIRPDPYHPGEFTVLVDPE